MSQIKQLGRRERKSSFLSFVLYPDSSVDCVTLTGLGELDPLTEMLVLPKRASQKGLMSSLTRVLWDPIKLTH